MVGRGNCGILKNVVGFVDHYEVNNKCEFEGALFQTTNSTTKCLTHWKSIAIFSTETRLAVLALQVVNFHSINRAIKFNHRNVRFTAKHLTPFPSLNNFPSNYSTHVLVFIADTLSFR